MSLEEIHKKRKMASEGGAEVGSPQFGRNGKEIGKRFERIKAGDVSFHDERLKSNAFDTKVSAFFDAISRGLK